jgi:hypothetical protein
MYRHAIEPKGLKPCIYSYSEYMYIAMFLKALRLELCLISACCAVSFYFYSVYSVYGSFQFKFSVKVYISYFIYFTHYNLL